ncbi:dihydrofolate reductase-like domain-containing protein [Desarmillaria tabescens]|uniref:Dihydrofolate reductase n=1 Tax=Armillaria tabescens TaxID=1929756 RepID=A0AA39NG73_ARMTA|nr:dihydrofolate reductase-like domain-containing protein [Desarmillaria tabescens]KAK0465048.1 dihydrofolate reductase-like domain-containing protein [Desarmillaria tabescens]
MITIIIVPRISFTTGMSRLTIIVAATKNNGIGKNSQLPWRLPKEISYFARVTSNAPEGMHNAVIMGRNTYESIPPKFRPLSDRINIVISRNEKYDLCAIFLNVQSIFWGSTDNATAFLESGLRHSFERLLSLKDSIHRAFVIGGASLYSECLRLSPSSIVPFVDRILLTRVISPSFDECDVFMPDFLAETNGEGVPVWKRATL